MNDLPGQITSARDTASQLSGVASDYAAGEQSVMDILRGKIQEAYSSNQDLIGKLDQSIGNYLPSPQVGREKYQNIFNPFQRESLVSQYTANQAIPMMTNAGLLGQRLGRIEDLVGAGTRAYGAESARKQGKAQTAQQQYSNLLNEYQIMQPQTSVIEADGRQLLINSKTGEVIQDLGAAPPKAGSGSDFSGLESLLGLLMGAEGGDWEDLGEQTQKDTGFEYGYDPMAEFNPGTPNSQSLKVTPKRSAYVVK